MKPKADIKATRCPAPELESVLCRRECVDCFPNFRLSYTCIFGEVFLSWLRAWNARASKRAANRIDSSSCILTSNFSARGKMRGEGADLFYLRPSAVLSHVGRALAAMRASHTQRSDKCLWALLCAKIVHKFSEKFYLLKHR